jgi:hypothetical protein
MTKTGTGLNVPYKNSIKNLKFKKLKSKVKKLLVMV